MRTTPMLLLTSPSSPVANVRLLMMAKRWLAAPEMPLSCKSTTAGAGLGLPAATAGDLRRRVDWGKKGSLPSSEVEGVTKMDLGGSGSAGTALVAGLA